MARGIEISFIERQGGRKIVFNVDCLALKEGKIAVRSSGKDL